MSIPTWPGNLPSREIYAGDIAGLRAGIQRIESMVGGSDSWEDRTISLVPVTDQVDSTLHRRIYEPASLADRGWIPGTMGMPPEIFRNGVSVFTAEYTLHPADGFVVFHAQQAVNAIITAANLLINGDEKGWTFSVDILQVSFFSVSSLLLLRQV